MLIIIKLYSVKHMLQTTFILYHQFKIFFTVKSEFFWSSCHAFLFFPTSMADNFEFLKDAFGRRETGQLFVIVLLKSIYNNKFNIGELKDRMQKEIPKKAEVLLLMERSASKLVRAIRNLNLFKENFFP